MVVLAIDPGVTTGYCLGRGERVLEAGSVSGLLPTFELLHRMCTRRKVEHIVMEKFTRGATFDKYQLETVEICGIVELVAAQHKLPIAYQMPVTRKPHLVRAKEQFKQMHPGIPSNPHAVDAIAHWMAFRDSLFAEGRSSHASDW